MKSLVALLLSCSILAGTFHWDEWVKVPALISHYSNHHKSDRSLTFAGFLFNHYPDSGLDQMDHHRLPFKSKKIISHLSIFSFESKSIFIPCLTFSIVKFPDTSYEIKSGLSDIFLPPKIG